jgi:hypothetical protein
LLAKPLSRVPLERMRTLAFSYRRTYRPHRYRSVLITLQMAGICSIAKPPHIRNHLKVHWTKCTYAPYLHSPVGTGRKRHRMSENDRLIENSACRLGNARLDELHQGFQLLANPEWMTLNGLRVGAVPGVAAVGTRDLALVFDHLGSADVATEIVSSREIPHRQHPREIAASIAGFLKPSKLRPAAGQGSLEPGRRVLGND